ncbi:uncharacterized protein TRIVIDRAFT_196418 [Trichoderma virens Gv29-8]|uniref:Mediator complex subunit 15 KIX domain-containing protein n=1 Tax=Hypocrea virens (strain Gv29-8 / FGSC 10586) TaxID=413071 RepID=G9ND22_HYPVG|nr:uncharacterized protein TRIVIDRAFT_196418 [Trichoderma virens Gv29-8]EHK15591.1 hypothetical protein TRIVIDRAFT_196418 [Trichoderma virens Gv29-8]
MQHMAGGGPMIPQQMRKPTPGQLQQIVYQNIQQNTPPMNGMTWQSNFSANERMGKALDLISNISLAMGGLDYNQATNFGCQFEREVFHKSPTKEAYDQAMQNKTMDFFKKRQANEPTLQNTINANAQAQAHAHAQAQAQMGRGAGQTPQQGFQHMQHPMQAAQMPQQQPQQPQQPLFQQQQIAMGMANQAGRGIGPNQQAMGMPGAPNRPALSVEMARLGPADRTKVNDLATKMMNQATEQQRAATRLHLQSRLSAQQLAEFHAQAKDPLLWWYQHQAFQALKQSSLNSRFQQGGPANQTNPQAAMMQQQHSQQSLQQQRQNMMSADPQSISAHDFTQFTPNMESIKDQQMTGLMAQQAGQVVVPASNGAGRNATPQPGNQNIPNQQVQNQTPRPGQQQQQQPQQAKLNQAAQQSQALQAQAQMKLQNQQQMAGGMATSQSPGMNTLNTPVTRPGGINPMAPQGMGQAGIQFGDQRFHQGIQRPNNAAFNAMLANMTPEQRQAINGLPQEKLTEVLRRWQSQRQEQMRAANGNPMVQAQMANRPQNQFGQMGPGMGPGPQMSQANAAGVGNQQQPMQMGRMAPPQGPQLALLMDSMDLPPNVVNQLPGLPVEVKKWRDLKAWITQNNNSIQPQNRNQLLVIQQRQFQMLMQRRAGNLPQQPGQGLNINAGMPMQMAANQQPTMQQPMGNIPPQLLQVSAQEIMHIRSQKPGLVNVPDEQLRNMLLQMKRSSWQQQQQQQQLRAQQAQAAQVQANQQQPAPNHMAVPQAPMQLQQPPQPNLTPQSQAQVMPNAMSQTASMQASNQKQQPNTNQNQARNNQPQPPKNLKRPNPDDSADTATSKAPTPVTRPAAAPSQPAQQPIQRMGPKFTNFTPLTAAQEASLTPEQKARYDQILKNHGKVAAAATAASGDSLNRLKLIGQEEQRQFSQEQMVDIPMGPEEYAETAQKLKRIVSDMSKVGRGLSKWYAITQDDARAKMFFRTRLRIIKQHVDGEQMEAMKDVFSIRSSDLDQARAMLESMAKDLAASQQAQQQAQLQAQQQAQQQNQQKNQPGHPAPLNAANLEKNAQALKLNQQKQANKAGQVPPAPTTTQPPFPFGATSPHGNPSYMSKPKDLNLQLPPARKKQKIASGQHSGPPSQGATPSPQIAKTVSPDIRRPQGTPKPVILCTEPDCDMSYVGFPNEQALQHHIDEEHTKPKEDPVKFLQENLALALGLEIDGSVKKEQKPVDGAQAMSASTSKQGHGSGNFAGTPMSQDGTGMKRSVSSMSKDAKAGIKSDTATKHGDGKQAGDATMVDPWASSTIDPQTLLQNLGFENGLPTIANEAKILKLLTPKGTPDSGKDVASEPNSDISEGAALDISMFWHSLDKDYISDFHAANHDGSLPDEALALLQPVLLNRRPGVPDWDSMQTDFTKPFEFDLSHYSMDC